MTEPDLKRFISPQQLHVLRDLCKGEEVEHFITKLQEISLLIQTMPTTHETSALGDDAMVQLHYFSGSSDWWIVERDVEVEQLQAFGFICLGGDKQNAELGYIDLEEILNYGVEIDLYWEPVTLREIKKRHGKVSK